MRAVAAFYHEIVSSSLKTHLPTIEEIRREQEKISRPEGVFRDFEGAVKNHGVTWIQDDANQLKLRILIGAYRDEVEQGLYSNIRTHTGRFLAKRHVPGREGVCCHVYTLSRVQSR